MTPLITLMLFLLPATAPATPKTAKPANRNWTRLQVKAEMDDSKILVFYTRAAIPATKHEAMLRVQCVNEESILVDVDADSVVEAPYQGQLMVRFDQDDPGYLPWERTEDHESLSSNDPRVLVRDYLLGAKTFRLQYTEFPATIRIVTFHVAGLEPLIHGHCGL